jgi:hypothetical protein
MAIQTDDVRDRRPGTPRRNRAFAVVAAVAAAIAAWAVGEPLLGYDLVVTQPGQDARDLGIGAIAVFALASALLGWALLAGLERVTSHAKPIWTAVALAVLAASFLPLIGVEASGGSKAVLALSHLAVGAVIIPVFRQTAKTGGNAQPATAGR